MGTGSKKIACAQSCRPLSQSSARPPPLGTDPCRGDGWFMICLQSKDIPRVLIPAHFLTRMAKLHSWVMTPHLSKDGWEWPDSGVLGLGETPAGTKLAITPQESRDSHSVERPAKEVAPGLSASKWPQPVCR